jgi:hypothetical protein
VGFRIPGVIGSILFGTGQVWYIARTGDHLAYASDFLPGMAISGAGVGLVIPTLTGAGTASLAPQRFATGAAVLTMGRQIGSALGIAILVAVLGTSAHTAAAFHSAWLIALIGAGLTCITLSALGPPRTVSAIAAEPEPEPAKLDGGRELAAGALESAEAA